MTGRAIPGLSAQVRFTELHLWPCVCLSTHFPLNRL